jgi:alpha-tubulin suppressor-like RCC1 family protein
VPSAFQATITNHATGVAVTAGVVNGGFDPVALAAGLGDTLFVEITRNGSEPLHGGEVIRAGVAPVVVRTSPTRGGIDVPLDSVMRIVFSEPLDSATVDPSSVTLWRGTTPIAGTVRFADSLHLRVEFHPDGPAAPQTDYQLVVTTAIRDLNGVALDSAVAVPFTTATAAPAGNLVFASVSVGSWHTCGVTTAGAAYCWGYNHDGQLGTGDTTNSTRPVPVAGGLGFKAVSSGTYVTCGVTTAGTLYCWGKPGGPFPPYGVDYGWNATLVPVRVFGWLTFATVSVRQGGACGVTTAGTAYCWGAGWLGNGTVYPDPVSPPALVSGGLTFTAMSSGGPACGVTTAGAAYCWGSNSRSALGTGTEAGPDYCGADSLGSPINSCSTVPVPVAGGLTFSQVETTGAGACGLTTSGAAYCWGSNQNDGHGFGTNTGPEQCAGDDGRFASNFTDSLDYACSRLPRAVPGAPVLVSLSGSYNYTCGLTAARAAYCWGHPQQTGDLNSNTAPVAVPGGLTFTMLSAGPDDTCGVTTTGGAYCWGQNLEGELGDGTTTPSSVPVRVAGQP